MDWDNNNVSMIESEIMTFMIGIMANTNLFRRGRENILFNHSNNQFIGIPSSSAKTLDIVLTSRTTQKAVQNTTSPVKERTGSSEQAMASTSSKHLAISRSWTDDRLLLIHMSSSSRRQSAHGHVETCNIPECVSSKRQGVECDEHAAHASNPSSLSQMASLPSVKTPIAIHWKRPI